MSKSKINLTFEERLNKSNSEVIRERSGRLAIVTYKAQRRLIDALEDEVDKIRDKMNLSLDINPKNSYSLVVGEDFNHDAWVKQYQGWKIELANKEFELKLAKETMKEQFPQGRPDGEAEE